MTASGDTARGAGVRMSGHETVMIAAVLIVGLIAAAEVSPLIAAPTIVMAWLLGREARRIAMTKTSSLEWPEFPPALRETVERTIDQLPSGDARRLLSDALAQARPLLAPHAAQLDARQENATRDNILSLVDACCTTALELGRLDAASAARAPDAPSENASRVASARELLSGRLIRAATALSSLYAVGVGQGSPASDRVAQLADEINADASARQRAATEISALLSDGEHPPPAEQPKC